MGKICPALCAIRVYQAVSPPGLTAPVPQVNHNSSFLPQTPPFADVTELVTAQILVELGDNSIPKAPSSRHPYQQ